MENPVCIKVIPNIICHSDSMIVKDAIETEAPMRVGLCVKDMSTFALGKPGGGGVGFSLDIHTHCKIVNSVETISHIISNRPLIVQQAVDIFKAHFPNFPQDACFQISTWCDLGDKTHIGLGTTSSCALAVLMGLNAMFEPIPFTMDQLRTMWVLNYVEEDAKNSKLTLGYETGMTGCAAQDGGIFVVETDALSHKSYPMSDPNIKVFICVPSLKLNPKFNTVESMEEEQELLQAGGKVDDDDKIQKHKSELFDFKIRHALEVQDLKKFGDDMWSVQGIGSKRVEIVKQGRNIFKFMQHCHDQGFELVAMSSIGPSVVVVTEKKLEDLRPVLDLFNFEMLFQTRIDNHGGQIVNKTKIL